MKDRTHHRIHKSGFRLIRLGTDRHGNIVYFPESGSYNVVIILARPRYGKSILIKNLYVQIAQGRRIIVIDYLGEHDQSKYGNWKAKGITSFIPDLYTIENFAFFLTDFNRVSDWISMGASIRAAPLIAELIKCENIHQNDPIRFLELLRALPSKDDDLERFNDKFGPYGLTFSSRVNDASKHSMITVVENAWISGLLMPPVESDSYKEHTPGKAYVKDWAELARRHPHININLNLTTNESVTLARAAIGKILEQLAPVLEELSPLIICEESDFIAPSTEDENITSLNQLRKYVLKHQRTGVELMFITQNPNMLSQFILLGGTIWVMGPHTADSTVSSMLDEPHLNYLKDVIHKLKFDRYKNEREFVLMESGAGGHYKIFSPDESVTRIAR